MCCQYEVDRLICDNLYSRAPIVQKPIGISVDKVLVPEDLR